jgi:hypothetical protein
MFCIVVSFENCQQIDLHFRQSVISVSVQCLQGSVARRVKMRRLPFSAQREAHHRKHARTHLN